MKTQNTQDKATGKLEASHTPAFEVLRHQIGFKQIKSKSVVQDAIRENIAMQAEHAALVVVVEWAKTLKGGGKRGLVASGDASIVTNEEIDSALSAIAAIRKGAQ